MKAFSKARWIASSVVGTPRSSPPNPYFRKNFLLRLPVRSATLHVTALGLYECEINGTKVGDEIFSPGWTDYHQRVQVQSYDVSKMLRRGKDAIGAHFGRWLVLWLSGLEKSPELWPTTAPPGPAGNRTGGRINPSSCHRFGSDSVNGEAIAEAVLDAGCLGYRHFDCAAVYGNEHLIGAALQRLMATGVRREELWITSKLWNDKHAENDVIPTCHKTLQDLRLDYLDLYLSIGPSPTFIPQGAT